MNHMQHFIESKQLFLIETKDELLKAQTFVDEQYRKSIHEHKGIDFNDYLTGHYSLPTLIWINKDESYCFISHQTTRNIMNDEYDLDSAINISVLIEPEKHPEYFI